MQLITEYKKPNKPEKSVPIFKYLILETGYTGRILNKVDFLSKRLLTRGNYKIEFIYDDNDGYGLYSYSKDYDKELVDFTVNHTSDATIVISSANPVYSFGDIPFILKELGYCKLYGVINTVKYDFRDGKVLIMTIASESR